MAIVSLLFMTTLLSVFVTGILMLLVLTKRNLLQKTLAVILGVFSIMMFVGVINMTQSSDHIHAVLSSPFRFRFLVLGLIAFFAVMAYYMVAAHRNLLTIPNGTLFLSPVFFTLVFYIAWHLGAGVPMDYTYASLVEMWENRYTVPVILRVLMYFFFLIYQGVMIHDMWYLDSLRGKHSILNSPDAVSNIRWLRMVVVGMIFILVVYSLLIFIPSIIVLLLYVIVTASVFIYFIYNALARKMYEDTEDWQATWTLREGWKVASEKFTSEQFRQADGGTPVSSSELQKTNDAPFTKEPDMLSQIDEWMKKEKPFCRTEFSIADIIVRFPNLNHEKLTQLLQKTDSHSQAYIRRHRIEEACRIIRCEKTVKVQELALRVGFSHPSSFSRSFTAVMNETVVQYISKMGIKSSSNNKPMKKDNNNTITTSNKKENFNITTCLPALAGEAQEQDKKP